MVRRNKPVILVVDDLPENIDVLKGLLHADYTIRPAIRGAIALKAVHVEPLPDLILLDVMMPGMNGYEVCRQLKNDKRTQEIPIIFVTAKSEESDELLGLELGAVDYITKPISPPIVRARVKAHIALREAQNKLEERNRTLLAERELIESIILKMRADDLLDDRHLRYLVAPVEDTAGDMLLAAFAADGRQFVLLGDFTGHGLPAAVGSPLVAYIFHTMATQGCPGETMMREINQQLYAKLPINIFFAASLIEVSADRRTIKAFNAGLPDSLLMRGCAITQRVLSQTPALGILGQLNFAESMTVLSTEPGDRFYIFSDGIVEFGSDHGEMFGQERLEACLIRVVQSSSSLNQVLEDLQGWGRITDYKDDITLVEIAI